METLNFYDFTLESLSEHLEQRGHKSFRAQQLFRWVYGLGELDFSKMTNLSKTFREELPSLFHFERPAVVSHLVSRDGTQKFLFDVGEGRTVEAVAIPSTDRMTLCVSSEVGCNLACKFCFTGKQKLKRRLRAGEIVSQFLTVNEKLPEHQKITNVVFMGMGEPLDNPEGVFDAIQILHNSWGLNFSRKKVTVSTSGLVPMIPRVTESGARLAVSLNATTDKIRDYIMPINKKYNIDTLLEACKEHSRISKDKVTMEYVLLQGVTDSLQDARRLHRLLSQVPSKINIIPFNEHPGSDFKRPSEEAIVAFHKELMRLGSHVLRRKTMGRDIYAACGQLTSAHKNHPIRMSV